MHTSFSVEMKNGLTHVEMMVYRQVHFLALLSLWHLFVDERFFVCVIQQQINDRQTLLEHTPAVELFLNLKFISYLMQMQ